MKLKSENEANWNKWVDANTDPYGKACVDYARAWADLMEQRMEAGEHLTIADCAGPASHDVDDNYDITGFMYGCAVSMLAQCWLHGEELRRWHNKETQLGTEGDRANENGGVLNPALLNIG